MTKKNSETTTVQVKEQQTVQKQQTVQVRQQQKQVKQTPKQKTKK